MQHECKITVLETKVFPELQEKYLADPKSGPCPCCNDGTRPVIFKIERIDIPETPEEKAWLARQNFTNSVDDAYTG